MGFRQIRTSDIIGATIDDSRVVTVVVHAAGKQFDTTAEEIAPLTMNICSKIPRIK
jgi:hypothetical protein